MDYSSVDGRGDDKYNGGGSVDTSKIFAMQDSLFCVTISFKSLGVCNSRGWGYCCWWYIDSDISTELSTPTGNQPVFPRNNWTLNVNHRYSFTTEISTYVQL